MSTSMIVFLTAMLSLFLKGATQDRFYSDPYAGSPYHDYFSDVTLEFKSLDIGGYIAGISDPLLADLNEFYNQTEHYANATRDELRNLLFGAQLDLMNEVQRQLHEFHDELTGYAHQLGASCDWQCVDNCSHSEANIYAKIQCFNVCSCSNTSSGYMAYEESSTVAVSAGPQGQATSQEIPQALSLFGYGYEYSGYSHDSKSSFGSLSSLGSYGSSYNDEDDDDEDDGEDDDDEQSWNLRQHSGYQSYSQPDYSNYGTSYFYTDYSGPYQYTISNFAVDHYTSQQDQDQLQSLSYYSAQEYLPQIDAGYEQQYSDANDYWASSAANFEDFFDSSQSSSSQEAQERLEFVLGNLQFDSIVDYGTTQEVAPTERKFFPRAQFLTEREDADDDDDDDDYEEYLEEKCDDHVDDDCRKPLERDCDDHVNDDCNLPLERDCDDHIDDDCRKPLEIDHDDLRAQIAARAGYGQHPQYGQNAYANAGQPSNSYGNTKSLVAKGSEQIGGITYTNDAAYVPEYSYLYDTRYDESQLGPSDYVHFTPQYSIYEEWPRPELVTPPPPAPEPEPVPCCTVCPAPQPAPQSTAQPASQPTAEVTGNAATKNGVANKGNGAATATTSSTTATESSTTATTSSTTATVDASATTSTGATVEPTATAETAATSTSTTTTATVTTDTATAASTSTSTPTSTTTTASATSAPADPAAGSSTGATSTSAAATTSTSTSTSTSASAATATATAPAATSTTPAAEPQYSIYGTKVAATTAATPAFSIYDQSFVDSLASSRVNGINQISIDRMDYFEELLNQRASSMPCNENGCVSNCLTYFHTMEGKMDCFDLCFCYTNQYQYTYGYGFEPGSYDLVNFFQEHTPQGEPFSLLFYLAMAALILALIYIIHRQWREIQKLRKMRNANHSLGNDLQESLL